MDCVQSEILTNKLVVPNLSQKHTSDNWKQTDPTSNQINKNMFRECITMPILNHYQI